jgi:hypothetical protein
MVQILRKILFTDGANIREDPVHRWCKYWGRSCSQMVQILRKILFTDGANIEEDPVHRWCKYL